MYGINGIGKNGYTASVGQGKKEAGKTEKKDDRKEKNTDKAEFSPFAKNGINGGFKVGAASEKTSGLSQKAQDYLEKLKKKYGNMDFIISDFSSDEEADKLLAKGKGEYNVLISPDLLERMADDEDTAAEYEAMIDKSVESIDSVRDGLGEDKDMVDKYGVTFDSNGNMTIRAVLAGDLTAKDGTNTVKASTVEDMLAQLREAKEAQSEKLEKLRVERAEKEEKTEADTDEVDREITKLKDDRREITQRMHAVIGKEQKAELEELLKQLDGEIAEKDNDAYRRSHAHFSAKA